MSGGGASRAGGPPLVGIVYPGDPSSPATWSGVPAGLGRGLEKAGVRVAWISAEPPPVVSGAAHAIVALRYLPPALPAVRFSLVLAAYGPELAAVRSRALRRRLGGRVRPDALVLMGGNYTVDADIPFAVCDDKTVVQARRTPSAPWNALPERAYQQRLRLQRDLYRRATACCALSSWPAESMVRDFGVPPERVHVVGVGRNHQPKPRERDWSRPRFLFVGSEWDRKNGDAVVRAFSRVRERVPEARLDVVGRHPRIETPGVTGHGPIFDRRVEELFASATCFVLPSLVEPSALAYAEAAAAGVPSIGTAVGGSGDIIGEAGRILDPRDEEALLQAMLELCDPATARGLGALALERSKLFTYRAMAERVLRALGLPGVELDGLAEPLPAR